MNSGNYILYLLLYRIVVHYVIFNHSPCCGLCAKNSGKRMQEETFIWITIYLFIYWICIFHLGLIQLSQSLCFNDFINFFPLCLWSGPIFLMEELSLNCLKAMCALLACCPRMCERRNSIKNSLNWLANSHFLGMNNFVSRKSVFSLSSFTDR